MSKAAIEKAIQARIDEVYAALNQMLNGDATTMATLWSHQDDVTAMFSPGGRAVGWDPVIKGMLTQIAALHKRAGIKVTVAHDNVHVNVEDKLAYALVDEKAAFKAQGQKVKMTQRTTLVFRPEDNTWKIVHIHNDTVGSLEQMFSMLMMNLS